MLAQNFGSAKDWRMSRAQLKVAGGGKVDVTKLPFRRRSQWA